eukprot:jgi/Phyca11/13698/fgenesh1_pg.PHYCAscaffold_4_\
MPGQFVDVVTVAVASPTTLAPSLKDVEEPVAVLVAGRGGRSQSLSTLPRRASTANVLTVQNNQCDTFTEEEEIEFQSHQRARHSRRALSSGTGSSLSLLQEELGYPRRARVAVDHHRHRRGSLLETALENTLTKRIHSSSHGSSHEIHSSSSSSSSHCTSDLSRAQSVPEPEAENQIHYQGRSWTFNSTTCSPRSDAAGIVTDVKGALDDEEEENFMNYRSASVTGYSRDTDGVVYYEVIVRSTAHGPLSAYKVRRRYSEFRDLHTALSKVMPVSHKKLASVTAMASISDENSNNEEEDAAVGLRFSITDCGEDNEPTLPPLPDKGGVWSYLQFDSIPLLERRAKYFHAMMVAAQRHPAARASRLLNDFVGTPPDLVSLHSSVENSYVSLNRFAAPKLSFDIEIQERKEKAKSIRRRRSSIKRQSFTGSLDASFNSPRPSQ